jgi:hypothetical protein
MTVSAYKGTIETPSASKGATPRRQHVVRGPDGSLLASTEGFGWGCGGHGTARTALAILTDCTGDSDLATRLCQAFKWSVILRLPADEEFTLSVEEVRQWVALNAPRADTQVPWTRHDHSGDGAVDIH